MWIPIFISNFFIFSYTSFMWLVILQFQTIVSHKLIMIVVYSQVSHEDWAKVTLVSDIQINNVC